MENTAARIFDEKDKEFYIMDGVKFVSKNESGPISGHYMQVKEVPPVDGRDAKFVVCANAVADNLQTEFKEHSRTVEENGDHVTYVILEDRNGRVVAIDQTQTTTTTHNTVIVKELQKSPSNFETLQEVKNKYPEVLFYKVPRANDRTSTDGSASAVSAMQSESFYFKSFLDDQDDQQRILGFDRNGNALNPTEVQPNSVQSLFYTP